MGKGRRSEQDIAEIKKFIVSLILNRSSEINDSNGNPSPKKITILCKDELDKQVNEHTIAKYLKSSDLMNYSHLAKPQHNERMRDLDERIRLAKAMSKDSSIKPKERIMALNSYKGLFNEKSKYEKQLSDERVKTAEVSRPVHLLIFGHFENVKKTCPKCKHEFYDIEDVGGEEKDGKQKKFKSGSGQSTL